MRVAVVGLGYVGLVTATCLARLGQSVIGLEADRQKVRLLRDGEVPYYEPGLDGELAAQRAAGRLHFTDDPAEALREVDAVLICVGTPSDPTGRADLQYVLDVAHTIGTELASPAVIALRSTVPIGTTQRVEQRLNESLRRRGREQPTAVIANPEFLRTGRAIDDFLRPARVILGRTELATDSEVDRLASLYQPLNAPLLIMAAKSAELVKNAANAFLATRVSFVNELAQLCQSTGASIDDVVRGMAFDPRIGGDFLRPGLGYGGSCLPKDVRSLISMGSDHEQSMGLARAVDEVNRGQPIRYARLLTDALGGDVTGRRIGILGLSFKPDTDDIRDSPALALARTLRDQGAHVAGCDPEAAERVRAVAPWIELAGGPVEAARGADAIVLATEWPAYVTLDPRDLASVMRGRIVVDARNVLDPGRIDAAGLIYLAIGRMA